MMSKVKSHPEKMGPFSHDEVKALLFALGIGVVLGFALERIDASLPKNHRMSTIAESLMKGRQGRKGTPKSAYDMQRPGIGFSVTD